MTFGGDASPQTTKRKFPVWVIVALICMALMCCACLVMLGVWMINRSDFNLDDLFGLNSSIAQSFGDDPTPTYTFAPVEFQTRTPESGQGIPAGTPETNSNDLEPTHNVELTPFRMAVGYRAPEFSLESVEGESVTLSEQRGNYVVLDYWATWCPPCREEIPFIQNIHEDYWQQGLVILGVNNIEGDDLSSVQDVIDDEALTYAILLDYDNVVMSAYNIQFFPTSIFIDADGVIRDIVIGSISEQEFRDKVEYLMSGSY